MNKTTKTVVGWVAILIVIATLVLGGNYLIYTYVGLWNYIGLSLLSGLVWAWILHRSHKTHDADMLLWATQFVETNRSLIDHIKDEAK